MTESFSFFYEDELKMSSMAEEICAEWVKMHVHTIKKTAIHYYSSSQKFYGIFSTDTQPMLRSINRATVAQFAYISRKRCPQIMTTISNMHHLFADFALHNLMHAWWLTWEINLNSGVSIFKRLTISLIYISKTRQIANKTWHEMIK